MPGWTWPGDRTSRDSVPFAHPRGPRPGGDDPLRRLSLLSADDAWPAGRGALLPFPYATGAWQGADLVGFIFGGTRHGAVSGFVRNSIGTIAVGLLKHPRAVGHLAAPKVLPVLRLVVRRPRSAGQAIETHGREAAPCDAAPRPRSFGVLSIAVAPRVRGTGIAVELMEGAEQAALAAGYESMHLTVDAGNGRAVRFYQKLGWRTSSPGGEGGQVMTKSLTT